MSTSEASSFSPVDQILAFGDQLQSLRRRVELLEAARAQSPSSNPPPSWDALATKGAEWAQEIFRAPIRIERDYDPESPEYVWYNLWVTSDATHDELRPLRQQWYDRITAMELSDPTVLRLLVSPRL